MYGTVADCKTHWDDRGYTYSIDDAAIAKLGEIASDFVDGLGWREIAPGTMIPLFPGQPADAAQTRQWPRKEATDIYGNTIADDEIPAAVTKATYEAAYYAMLNSGGLNRAYKPDQQVQSRRVETLARTFFEPKSVVPGQPPTKPIIPAVNAALAPVMAGGTNPYGITGVVA